MAYAAILASSPVKTTSSGSAGLLTPIEFVFRSSLFKFYDDSETRLDGGRLYLPEALSGLVAAPNATAAGSLF